jgi:hypothetical protein
MKGILFDLVPFILSIKEREEKHSLESWLPSLSQVYGTRHAENSKTQYARDCWDCLPKIK